MPLFCYLYRVSRNNSGAGKGGRTCRDRVAVVSGERADSHLVPLPGSEWALWRDAQLRSAGFPAAGLDRFSAPECAAAADAFLGARAERADLEAAYAAAVAQGSTVVAEIAADPLFREALTWQNPRAAARIATEAPTGQSAWQRRNRTKAKENLITRYWQRYCAKNDTIGFFGPTAWVSLDPEAPAVRAHHGDRLGVGVELVQRVGAVRVDDGPRGRAARPAAPDRRRGFR